MMIDANQKTKASHASLFQLAPHDDRLGLSVVTPMYNEAGGARKFIEEIHAILATMPEVISEIIIVDDGSTDNTKQVLLALREEGIDLRVLAHRKNAGQSRGIRSGVLAAKYDLIAMIDGDGQNDPKDIPALYAKLREENHNVSMVAGERQKRQDSGAKRYASRLANSVRQKMLNDGAADSGCGLKVFRRKAFLRLPYFDHLHRYLPFLMQREGFEVRFMPVSHRPRVHGASKYTNMGRLLVAFRDLIGVLWLKARSRSPEDISEL